MRSISVMALWAMVLASSACGPGQSFCDGGPCTEDARSGRPPAGGPACFASYDSGTDVLPDEMGSTMKVVTGQNARCALLQNGALYCWGDANYTGIASAEPVRVPTLVASLSQVVDVDVGTLHSCAVVADGTVHCWGAGAYRELGSDTQRSATPIPVEGVSDAVEVRVGGFGSCAILRDRSLRCWGPIDPRASIATLRDVVDMSIGTSHACAVLADRTLRCISASATPAPGATGRDTLGQFSPIAGVSDAIDVIALDQATCVLLRTGVVQCWGTDGNGDLGTGDCDRGRTLSQPTAVHGITSAIAIGGGGSSMCAVLSDHTVHCWGTGALLPLGLHSVPWLSAVPVRVPGIASAVSVDASGGFYGRTAMGSVLTWGTSTLDSSGRGAGPARHIRIP
jgi:alpha-tubulin suppressor-like RCC1 family protein